MRHTVIIAARKSDHQSSWGEAFASGIRRHGWSAVLTEDPEPCDLLVFWGVRKGAQIRAQKKAGGEVCILERGYIGDRFKWTSVSFGGGLNGHGEFRGPLEDPSRWKTHFDGLMRPWRERRDGYALIMGQVPGDMSLDGLRPRRVWQSTAEELQRKGYDVRFRPHPLAGDVRLNGVPNINGDLQAALDGAAMVVGINSNATVDSVLAGVPTVTLDDRAMAWPVTGHEPEFPPAPDRTEWAYGMAWTQWQMEELASGACWDAVGSVL